jgi:hypothetical protein
MMHALKIEELRMVAPFRKRGYFKECQKRAVEKKGGYLFVTEADYLELGRLFVPKKGQKVTLAKKRERDPYDQCKWPGYIKKWATKRVKKDRGAGDVFARLKASGELENTCGCTERSEIQTRRKSLNRAFPFPPKRYLTVCAIAKDELDIEEWVAYHIAVGVDHIQIYDNESAVPIRRVLRKWIMAEKVTVEIAKGVKIQNRLYTRFLSKSESRWVACIDIDEYLVPLKTDDVKDVLRGFEGYAGLGVFWKVFGSNGHVNRPQSLVMEAYTRTTVGWFDTYLRRNHWPQYKTLVQPRYAKWFRDPHRCKYGEGCAVNDAGVAIPRHGPPHGPPSNTLIQINHYIGKSLEDFRLKQARKGAMCNKPRPFKQWHYWERNCNAVEDRTALRFLPKVKALLEQMK